MGEEGRAGGEGRCTASGRTPRKRAVTMEAEPKVTITKAVVPAAGLGTRLYPATKSQAKEMLPLGTKPVIQHVVEELAQSGITEILIIVGRKKRAIEDHFAADAAWRECLHNSQVECEVWESDVQLFYTRQSEPRGLGDAVWHARAFCGGQPFVVALGDAVVMTTQGKPGTVVARAVEAFGRLGAAACIATYAVKAEDTERYGILSPADGKASLTHPFAIDDIVEKPGPEAAPSSWAVSARYVFSPAIFEALADCRKEQKDGEELELTAAIRQLIRAGGRVFGVPLAREELRLDVGNFATYGRAFARMLAMHPRHGAGFVEYLRRLVAYYEGNGPDPDMWAPPGG